MTVWQPVNATHPDAVALLVGYLRPGLAPVRVSVSMRGWRRPDPLVQVHRIGGELRGVDDAPQVQVDVRTSDYDSCWALASSVRSLLSLVPGSGLFRSAVEVGGPDGTVEEDGDPRVRLAWRFTVAPDGSI